MDRGTELERPTATRPALLELLPAPEPAPTPAPVPEPEPEPRDRTPRLYFGGDASLYVQTLAAAERRARLVIDPDGLTEIERRTFPADETTIRITTGGDGEDRSYLLEIAAPGFTHSGWYSEGGEEHHPDGRRTITARQGSTEVRITSVGEAVTIETHRELMPAYRRREIQPYQHRWDCALGVPDDCGMHRLADAVLDPARIAAQLESYMLAMRQERQELSARAGEVAAALVAAAEATPDELPPQNRQERRAAAAMERQGRPWRREALRRRELVGEW